MRLFLSLYELGIKDTTYTLQVIAQHEKLFRYYIEIMAGVGEDTSNLAVTNSHFALSYSNWQHYSTPDYASDDFGHASFGFHHVRINQSA